MGYILRLDCECGLGIVIRDRRLKEVVDAHDFVAGPFRLYCPLCGEAVWTYDESPPLDLGLVLAEAVRGAPRRPFIEQHIEKGGTPT